MENGLDYCFLNCEGMPLKMVYNIFESYLEDYNSTASLPFSDTSSHLTYPVRYALRTGLDPDMRLFYPQFREIFKVLIENGKSLEVNTSGLRQNIGVTLPDYDIVRLYRECGGELITVGSDAHTKDALGYSIREAYSVLSDIGFKYITSFKDHKAIQNKI